MTYSQAIALWKVCMFIAIDVWVVYALGFSKTQQRFDRSAVFLVVYFITSFVVIVGVFPNIF